MYLDEKSDNNKDENLINCIKFFDINNIGKDSFDE